jgi:hypothetical protein
VGSQRSFYIDNWISNGNTDINKQWKTCTNSLSLKWFLTITKIIWPLKTRSLNTDDQHHKYQKNKQIPPSSNQWTQKKTMTYASENLGLGLVQYNSSTDKKKWNAAEIRTLKKVNDIINIDSTIAGLVRQYNSRVGKSLLTHYQLI